MASNRANPPDLRMLLRRDLREAITEAETGEKMPAEPEAAEAEAEPEPEATAGEGGAVVKAEAPSVAAAGAVGVSAVSPLGLGRAATGSSISVGEKGKETERLVVREWCSTCSDGGRSCCGCWECRGDAFLGDDAAAEADVDPATVASPALPLSMEVLRDRAGRKLVDAAVARRLVCFDAEADGLALL